MALYRFMKRLGRVVLWLMLASQLAYLLFYLFAYRGDILGPQHLAWIIGLACTDIVTIFGYVVVVVLVVAVKFNPNRVYPIWWLSYSVVLIIHIALIFGLVEDTNMLQNHRFLNPEVLKGVVCITPFVLLLLIKTADHSKVSQIPATMAIELFVAIDMLDLAWTEKPKGLMIAIACGSLLLSAWQFAENTSSNDKSTVWRKIRLLAVIAIHLTSLIIRAMVVSSHDGTNETIFMAKNIITILTSILQICGCTSGKARQIKKKTGSSSARLLHSDEEESH